MQIHALAEDIDCLRRKERREGGVEIDAKHVKVLEYGADEHRTRSLVESLLKGEVLNTLSTELPNLKALRRRIVSTTHLLLLR